MMMGHAGLLAASGFPPYVGTKAGQTDGVDEYLTGPSQSLNAATGFSYSFWGKRNDAVGTEYVWQVRQTGTIQFHVQWLAGGTFNVTYTGAGGTTSSGVTIGDWAQITISVDKPADKRVRVWINGTLALTSTGATGSDTVAAAINVGRASTGSNYLNGLVCDIARWSTVLEEADAVALYNSGVRGDPEVLTGKTAAALWAFTATDNMTGTSGSIADLKGGTALTPFNTESGDLVAGP